MILKWDKWQRELIEHKGSVTARCGRQTGKSTAVGKRNAKHLLKYICSIMLIVAPAQRQSSGLFEKTRSWLEVYHDKALKKNGGWKANPVFSSRRNMELKRQYEYDHGIYNELPTKTTIVLKKDFSKPQSRANEGSICHSLPAGKTGVYLRFLSLDFLVIDEAAFVPEVVYNTLKPMLAISQKERGLGWESLLSTPFGKGGFFYHSHRNSDYRQFHVSAEDCPRYDKLFLAKERKRLTRTEYAQEYLAEFEESKNQYFPTDLLRKCMTLISWNVKDNYNHSASYYLGNDLGGDGGDSNTFVTAELYKNRVKVVQAKETERKRAPETVSRINVMNEVFNYRKIFTDSGGLGSPITDYMKLKLGKRKVVGLNNSKKRITEQGEEQKKGIFKEDLYGNALTLMETGMIDIINDRPLFNSLKSMRKEYTESGKIKIYGPNSHLSEGFVRACWCVKDRGLKCYIA